MELTQNETLPEAFRRKRYEKQENGTAAAAGNEMPAATEKEVSEAEIKVPAAVEAEWADAEGEGDDKNAGNL